MKKEKKILVSLLFLMFLPAILFADDGDLDTSFNGTGYALYNSEPDPGSYGEDQGNAVAIQSVMPWMNDKQLRQNFLSCYDDIWLKSDGIDQDYEKFRTVFGGFASRQEGNHPAAFMRSHLSYYGYNRQPDQPSEDMEFLFDLFGNFSIYAQTAKSFGSERFGGLRIY